MSRRLSRAVAAAIFCLAIPLVTAAQNQAPALDRPLRIFLDCRAGGCDQEFFRRELTWVDHMRDQKDSDVHVLITSQGTGGGGQEYTLRFIGHGPWEGQEDVFKRNTEAGATEDDRRKMLVQAFALGFARFAAATPIGPSLKVTPPANAAAPTQTAAKSDPWNYWVFRTGFNSNISGEESSKFTNLNINQSANRTTDAWKLNFNAGLNYNEGRYDLGDGEIFESFRRGWNVNALVVKSLTDHWSLGGRAVASRSSYLNQHLNLRGSPAIEWDFFPYSESTSRQLTFQYYAGPNHFEYDEVTIYGKTEETKWEHGAGAYLGLRQPFGSISARFQAAQFLDDPSKHRYSLEADLEIRVTRGLSVNFDGEYESIHDQIYLSQGEATDEEIIARQKQLATGYRYFMFVGITYRFGSINNNVVNPRLNGGF